MANDIENSSNDQLSLFDSPMNQMDFVEPTTTTKNFAIIPESKEVLEPTKNKAPRFITLSMALHAAAVLAIAVLSFPQEEQPKKEIITIDLTDSSTPQMLAKGEDVPATQGDLPEQKVTAAPIAAVMKPAPQVHEDNSDEAEAAPALEQAPAVAVVPAPAPAPTKVAKAVKTPKAAKIAASLSEPAESKAAKTTLAAVPATLSDINDPELDKGDLADAKVATNLDEDYSDDFAKVDDSQTKQIEAEKSKLDAMAAKVATEQDETLKSVDEENKQEAQRLEAAQETLKKKNADAIAAAVTAEKAKAAAATAAKEKAARDAAEKAQAEKEATALAAASATTGNGSGSGQGEAQQQGQGAGNDGTPDQSAALAGTPTGVRSLDQLRQKPGNPRPQYDRDERLRGDSGDISFLAYISKEGIPTRFQAKKLTGFRSLDAKTLSALKKWRFYPGQEGWVELPFKWDIKGGMQEDGGMLRSSVSQN